VGQRHKCLGLGGLQIVLRHAGADGHCHGLMDKPLGRGRRRSALRSRSVSTAIVPAKRCGKRELIANCRWPVVFSLCCWRKDIAVIPMLAFFATDRVTLPRYVYCSPIGSIR